MSEGNESASVRREERETTEDRRGQIASLKGPILASLSGLKRTACLALCLGSPITKIQSTYKYMYIVFGLTFLLKLMLLLDFPKTWRPQRGEPGSGVLTCGRCRPSVTSQRVIFPELDEPNPHNGIFQEVH